MFKKFWSHIAEYLIILFTVIIVLILLTRILNLQEIEYFDSEVSVESFITAVLFLGISALKNFNKIKLITILNRFNNTTLIILLTYNLTSIALLGAAIFSGLITPLLGLVIIILEIFVLIVNMYLNYIKKIKRKILSLVALKEVHFIILMLVILLHNYPFVKINLPLNIILAIIYVVIQINLIYSYLGMNRDIEIKHNEGEKNVR